MNAENGLRSIRDKRLRIGRIEELNDDFEMLGIALADKVDRVALRWTRRDLDKTSGVICMSEAWDSPLMWAHYADSHKGMVLGLDVPDHVFSKVEYVEKRPTLASLGFTNFSEMTPEVMARLIRLKAKGWEYEREHRAFISLTDGVDIKGQTHYFIPMGEEVLLREVIVGSRFKETRAEVTEAVNDHVVDIFMARGDFEEFKVVRNHQDSMWL